MILESKGFQAFFFIMGVVLVCLGIGCLLNFNDIYVNICLVKGSTFYYVLNKVLTALTLVFMVFLGGLFVWWVVYSVKKCRKFEEEKIRQPFNFKKFCLSVLFYVVIFVVLAVAVMVVNYFNRDAVSRVDMRGRSLKTSRQEKFVNCTMKVDSYHKKGEEINAGDWKNVSGVSTLVIESPENRKGEALTVRVIGMKETDNALRTVGATCSVIISDKYLMGRGYNNSKGYITSNDINVMLCNQESNIEN